ncbi:uncharacterized protein LOC122262058 [Penaeus japonicus]|uniref:uncharacterized protein LOC122262058 n=1 Tax=Penaeus japonicus TaxID=27405 RepID=UPI001C714621|nr:uncharacterized protein LOC122262058 [Penaeus japonicus]
MDQLRVAKWPQQIVAVTAMMMWCLVDTSTQTERRTDTPAADILARYPGQDDYISPTRMVWAAVGGMADLPCNLTSPIRDDPALLVLWYKQGVHKPIYSYDMRNGPATHWKSPLHFGTRADFIAASASLTIRRVHSDDEGLYRCRVDFRTNPTLTFTTNLTVIDPPQRLAVLTADGAEAARMLGPFVEGDSLQLACQASGGAPPPSVTWWEGDLLLDMTSEVEALDEVTNTLQVNALTRRDLLRSLTCRAANSNLTEPLASTVTIDMKLAPLWVRILNTRSSLSAGRPYDILCRSAGARPPAEITWRLDRSKITSHIAKLIHGDNVTTSELRWTPSVRDGGRVLSCHADSPDIQHPPLVDEWLLDVFYAPETTLSPGRSLNLSNIEEGDDVYFECSIRAHPWVFRIAWLHENHELEHNVSSGVIISNQSLVLQQVTRAASGNYFCVAFNVEGEGRSNPIRLRVKFAPICGSEQVLYHGAARYEKVNIPCHLDSHPRPHAYKWTFNNSGESVNIPETHIIKEDTHSTVSYTPTSELDYGTLLCWGTNTVGKQVLPCVFHVFPAGPPDPVNNCTVYNLSVDVVNVRCVAGFDGGLTQTFVLEVYEPRTNALLANISNTVPSFTVEDLPPGMSLKGVVYSSNDKGRGEMVSVKLYTLKDIAEKRTAAVKPPPATVKFAVKMRVGDIIAVVVGVAGGLVLVAVLACALVRVRAARRQGRGDKRAQEEGERESCASQSSAVELAGKDIPPPPAPPRDFDEKNPDVIPLSDSDSWNVEAVHTISTASLPTSYATLPRSSRSCTHDNFQSCGGDAAYTEFLLSGAVATPTPHHRHPHTASLARPCRAATYHAAHQTPLYHHPQPTSATATPTHVHSHHQQPLRASTHSVHQPLHGGRPPVGYDPWPAAPAIVRRHSLRRDPYPRDPEASVPLMAASDAAAAALPLRASRESVLAAVGPLGAPRQPEGAASAGDSEASVPLMASQKESSV